LAVIAVVVVSFLTGRATAHTKSPAPAAVIPAPPPPTAPVTALTYCHVGQPC
jgi:hypothetical protein